MADFRRRLSFPCLLAWTNWFVSLSPADSLSQRVSLSKRPLQDRLFIERSLAQRGYSRVIGTDESGTGCIAGPIVCCSVCIKQDFEEYQVLEQVNDSKLLDAATRQGIFRHVMAHPETYSVAVSIRTNQEIDASNAPTVIRKGFRETILNIIENWDEHSFYSIVDGSQTPLHLSIPSRAMPQADAHVYTVALASILARVTRDTFMTEYAALYPKYGFHRNGGYSTQEHVQAINTYGPSPLHRQTTKPVRGRENTLALSLSRRSILMAGIAAIVAVPQIMIQPTQAMTFDPRTGTNLPDLGEIENAIPKDWSVIDNPFEATDSKTRLFGRLDSSSDAQFYKDPRFVEHVDDRAVQLMTKYVSQTVAGTESILDLCTSWTSHIRMSDAAVLPRRIAGLGMNRQELDANPVLTERILQDLNDRPILPFESNSFDVVFCQLGIDYLTMPLEVCREISRVLKPGGSVHILFSNRLFLQKAVAVWTGADDIDHCFIVASYLHFCHGGFETIKAKDLSVRARNNRIVGDPLYVVTAVKSG